MEPSNLKLHRVCVKVCLSVSIYFSKIFFSFWAHFHLSGRVNQQNYRYWTHENLKSEHVIPQHFPIVTIWAANTSESLIGPYFFENKGGKTETVNFVRLTKMFFFQILLDWETNNKIHGFNCTTPRAACLRNLWLSYAISLEVKSFGAEKIFHFLSEVLIWFIVVSILKKYSKRANKCFSWMFTLTWIFYDNIYGFLYISS